MFCFVLKLCILALTDIVWPTFEGMRVLLFWSDCLFTEERDLDWIWYYTRWIETLFQLYVYPGFLGKPRTTTYLPKNLIQDLRYTHILYFQAPGVRTRLRGCLRQMSSLGTVKFWVVRFTDLSVCARLFLIHVIPGKHHSQMRSLSIFVLMWNWCLVHRNRKWSFRCANHLQSYLFYYIKS